MSADRQALAALTRLCDPGDTAVVALVTRSGAMEALRRVVAVQWPSRSVDDAMECGARDLALAASTGSRFVVPGDSEWPEEAFQPLRSYADDDPRGRALRARWDPDAGRAGPTRLAPPLGLWVRGPLRLSDVFPRSVAVVGSRAATGYGDHMAREIAFGLAERGWAVVSGGAYGIDAAAHRGALAANGPTVAVLAGGVDVLYPKGNAALLDRVSTCGCLLSERPPGSPVGREQFLVRNRTIAALGSGTVVVEAPVRSGALATARRAGLLGRLLMAVPGPATSSLSVGCHMLIREYGAVLVCSAREVLDVVGPIGAGVLPWLQGPPRLRDSMAPEDRAVLDVMPSHGVVRADGVASQLGWPVIHVLRSLERLVSSGAVARCREEGAPDGGAGFSLTDLGREDGREHV